MVMATQASISKPTPPSKPKKGKKAKPFRSVIGRTPNIQVVGNAIASPWFNEPPAQESGTVIAAGKFKATCLELLDRASRGETITITKRGKVFGRLVPPESPAEKPFVPLLGRMEGMVHIKGDIVGPHFDWWEKK